MFSSVGTSPPHIVDVDWRLDYYIKVQLQYIARNTLTICLLGNFAMLLLSSADIFKIFQEHYQSVKQLGSRSGLMVFWA